MKVTEIVIHHSACTAINGKGYDFYISRAGAVVPASEPTEGGGRLHICLEGDFGQIQEAGDRAVEEQLFIAARLVVKLGETAEQAVIPILPHNSDCPGPAFPWDKLVISLPDRYH
jgi:hypothetical protein